MNRHSLSTSNFKTNLKFIGKLILAVALLAGYINWTLPEYKNGYNASLIDKVDRLESISEPKIVLLGHSNLSFGINSELIEQTLGMPVVNMGFHGGNGNAFHEEMAKFNIVPGDIYIICHSNFNDNDSISGTMEAWSSIENHYNLWRILRINDIETMARSFPIYLKKSLSLYSSGTGNQDPGGVYARSAFNEYGDVMLQRNGSQYTFSDRVNASSIGDVTVGRINELNEYLTERGATLLIAGYPVGNGSLTADASEFIDFQNQLEQRLDCPVISNYVDYMFDYKYFYDTKYHLNTEGAELRTAQLISDIQRWQENGRDADMGMDIYEDIISDVNLSHITDMNEYLSALEKGKDRYTIIISAQDEAFSSINDEILLHLRSLGLEADLTDRIRYSYIGIVERGTVLYENTEHEKIEWSGTIDGGTMPCSVVSAGWDRGCMSSIVLNGQEYSENVRGLNFVVYSNETHRILDEVAFDTYTVEFTSIR